LRIADFGLRIEEKTMRPCGQCSVCCIDLRIDEKPPGAACPMLAGAGRCSTYAMRPDGCREYDCLWRRVDEDLLTDFERPDRAGVVFTHRLASQLGLPSRNGADWLVITASPAGEWGLSEAAPPHQRGRVAENPRAMEAVRRLRVAGLNVVLEETLPEGHRGRLERPLRTPTPEFATRLGHALEPPAIAVAREAPPPPAPPS
jgi:hypothetical protein